MDKITEFNAPSDSVQSEQETIFSDPPDENFFQHRIPRLFQLIDAEGEDKGNAFLDTIINEISSENQPKEKLEKTLSNLLSECVDRILAHGQMDVKAIPDVLESFRQGSREITADAMLDAFRTAALSLTHFYAAQLIREANPRLRQALEIIHRRYAEYDLTSTAIAEEANISYGYLSKLFSNTYGISMMDYLKDLRLEKSLELLNDQDRSIKGIAEATGFTDYRSFIRAFKGRHNITPGEYQKNLLKTKGLVP